MKVIKKFTDAEILAAGDDYKENGKQKYIGVTSFDFLAGVRWMEDQLKQTNPKRKEKCNHPLSTCYYSYYYRKLKCEECGEFIG